MNTQDTVTEDATQLDRTLISGMAWTAVLRWFAQLISWAATLYAARILVPADYGVVAMGMIPIGLMRMVEDFGLDSVLVQNRSIVGDQQSRLAGLALLVGIGCSLLFLGLAQPLASFFREPTVALAISALSVLFILDAVQIVPKATLQRNLEFRRLALVWLVQVFFTSAALVLGAYFRLGYWALILNTLAGAAAATLLLVWWHPYTIAWPSQIGTLTVHIRQGWRVLMSRATWYAYTSADQTVIGRMLGKDLLGAYSFATTFANVGNQEITSIVSRVVPGVFSQVQEQRSELRRYFLVLTELVAYLAFPIAAGIALTADHAMAVILGPQWSAVVLPLRILCIYSAFCAAQILVAHILMWTGQFRALMWCSVLTAVVLPLGFIFASRYGLPGIAWAWAILFPLTNIPPLIIGFRTIGISVTAWLSVLWPAIVASAGMAIAVTGIRMAMPESMSTPIQFAASTATGAATYATIIWFGFRPRIQALIDIVKAARA